MVVETVESVPLSYPLETAYGSARGTVSERASTLIRVETTDGTVGWGEAFGPPRTTATLVDELLADVVVGMDPFEARSLAERNYAGLYHFGSSGLIQSAVSGLDIALWDAAGREVGRPVYELLGGANRTTVRPYASTMYVREDERDPEVAVQAAVDEGFDAAKIKGGRGFDEDVERTRTAREALGEDGVLMVDVDGNYRPDQAIRVAGRLDAFDVHWLEEPVPPENVEGYRELKRHTDIPVAAGEAAYARFGFRRLIEDRAVDVVQPDVCKCGGLSEAQLIAEMATLDNVAVSPHCWMGGVGLLASLHYAAALPAYPHSTNVPEPLLFEFDRADNALREELLETPLDPDGGVLEIPDGPGLGVDVDEAAVERYRIDD